MEQSVKGENLHKKQQLFLQYQNSDGAHKIKDIDQVEEIPCWTDSQRKIDNLLGDISIQHQSVVKLDDSLQTQLSHNYKSMRKSTVEERQKRFHNQQTLKNKNSNLLCVDNSDFGIDKAVDSSRAKSYSVSNNNSFMNENNIITKARAKTDDQPPKEMKKKSLLSNQDNHQKLNQLGLLGKYTSRQIKMIQNIKQKMNYFFTSFTFAGRSRILNNQVRNFINDRSDLFVHQHWITALIMNSTLIYKITRCFKSLNISIIDCQSNLGIFITFIFAIYNCLYLLYSSLYIIFSGFSSYEEISSLTTFTLWTIEIILKLNTSIFVNSKQIEEREFIIRTYLKKKFIFDVIPLIILIAYKRYLIQIFLFLKIVNIIQDLSLIQRYLCMVVRRYYVVSLINLIFQIFLFAHAMACLWYLLALTEKTYLNEQHSWIEDGIGGDGVWWKQYFQALYWVLTLMMTGSNLATTTLQIIFIDFIMIFTAITFGYLLSVVSSILNQMAEKGAQKRRDINIINEYMRKKNISKTMQTKININLDHFYDMDFHSIHNQSQQILSTISVELRNSLTKEYNRKILNKMEILTKHFSSQTLDKLSLVATEEYYLPNQYIISQNVNQEPSLLYIIDGSGKVKVVNNQQKETNNQEKNEFILQQGDVFGQINFFSGQTQSHFLISSEFTQVLRIKNTDLMDIIQDQETEFEVYCQIRDTVIMYRQYADLFLSCKVCGLTTHQIYNCPKMHLDRDAIITKISLIEKKDQQRLDFQRRVQYKKRYQIPFQSERLIKLYEGHAKKLFYLNSIKATTVYDETQESYFDEKYLEELSRSGNTQSKPSKENILDERTQIDYVIKNEQSPQPNQVLNGSKTLKKCVSNRCSINLNEDTEKQEILQMHRGSSGSEGGDFGTFQNIRVKNKTNQQISLHTISFPSPAINTINEGEDKKNNSKKIEFMKSSLRRQSNQMMEKMLKFQQQSKQIIEQINVWQFDKLKDYQYYFKSGNSKYYLVKYAIYMKKRIKRIQKKLSRNRKNDKK